MDYIDFLKGKIKLAEFGGFEVADSGCQYLAAAEKQMDMPDLFAAMDMEQDA